MPPLALYIHWPFCKKKCPYCDFNSHVRDQVDHDRYRKALLSELRHMHTLVPDHILTSIFFGGGTPSLMHPKTAEALIDEATNLWPTSISMEREEGQGPDHAVRGDESRSEKGRRDAPLGERSELEITLEANPTSVESSTFPDFKSAGVNRVSLGIQSLREDELKFLGREHSASEALHALDHARKHFPRHNFDLIYALPSQSLNDWETGLTHALNYAGKHLSLYQLTIEPNTMFHHAYHEKKAFQLPPDNIAADMYDLTQQIMESNGLPAYEISNHATPGEESRHNLSYWKGHSYLGIGPGAHGRILMGREEAQGADHEVRGDESRSEKGRRQRAPLGEQSEQKTWHATLTYKTPERWLENVEANGHAIESNTILTPEEHLEERLMTGLRLREGLALNSLTEHEKALLASRTSQRTLDTLTSENLLEITPTHWRTTRGGKLVLNTILTQLLT